MTNIGFRVIVGPDALADIPGQRPNMQLAPQSVSQGGEELPGAVKSPRRSLRHSSLRSASNIGRPKNCSARAIRRQSVAPLSHGPGRLSHPSHTSHPRKLGSSSNTSTSTAHTALKNQTSSLPARKRCLPSDLHYPSVAISRSRAKQLLSQARQVIALRADWPGQKPAIMDVILDSRSPAVDFDEDALMEAIRRSRNPAGPPQCWYDFSNELSLATYWADEASRWSMRTLEQITTRIPDSDERSTLAGHPPLDKLRSESWPHFGHTDDT